MPSSSPVRASLTRVPALLALAGAACGPAAAQPVGDLVLVSYRGGAVPGLPGVTFGVQNNNLPPSFSNAGVLVLSTGLASGISGDEAILAGPPGSLGVIARRGQPAPGFDPPLLVGDLTSFVRVSPTGAVALILTLAAQPGVDTTNDFALVAGFPGDLRIVARDGAPSDVPGVTYNVLRTVPSIFDGDRVGFAAQVDPINDAYFLRPLGGAAEIVLREGSQAPDLPGPPSQVTFSDYNSTLKINRNRVAVVRATVVGPGISSTSATANNTGLWAGTPGALRLLAQQRSPAPGFAVAYRTAFGTSTDISLNAADQVVFSAGVDQVGIDANATTSALFGGTATDPGSIVLLAKEGDDLPGTSPAARFVDFESLVVDAAGRVASVATLEGPISSDTVVFRLGAVAVGGSPVAVLREGDVAPGFPGATVGNIGPSLGTNASGSLAFVSALGGVDAAFNQVLWLARLGEVPVPLLQKGQTVEVAPGDVRTVTDIRFNSGNAGQDSGEAGLNDADAVAVRLQLSDGVSTVDALAVVTAPNDCAADFDGSNTVDVADIFAYLSAWFAAAPGSDFDASGATDVSDIFAFLAAWFAGC